jgi:hypothetical protein
MTEPLNLNDIYRNFLDGEVSLEEAAARIRKHATPAQIHVVMLDIDRLSDAERKQAAIS